MIKSDSIVKIAGSLVKAQRNMANASKDAKNPFFKSKYADLNAVREAVLPALNAEGISVMQITATTDGKAVIQTLLVHESGEYLGSETDIVVAKQNDPQAYGSAVSYSRRYGLQALLCIGSSDDDGEANYARPAAPAAKVSAAAKIADHVATAEELPSVEVKRSSFRKTAPAPVVEAATDESTVEGWD